MFYIVEFETSNNKSDNISQRELLDALQAEIEILKEQLKIKDQQLAAADERLHESHVLNLNLSERGQQLLQAAIDEAADTPKPPPDVPTPPVKQKWYQRLFPRRKPT